MGKQKAQILAMMGGAAGLKKLKAKRKAAAAKPDEKISALKASEAAHDKKIAALKATVAQKVKTKKKILSGKEKIKAHDSKIAALMKQKAQILAMMRKAPVEVELVQMFEEEEEDHSDKMISELLGKRSVFQARWEEGQ